MRLYVNKTHLLNLDILNSEWMWRIYGAIYFVVLWMIQWSRFFNRSFWSDEVYTIKLIQNSVSDIVIGTAGDVHPPLYYMIVWIFYKILGPQEGATYHLATGIAFLILIIVSYTVIWKQYGKEVALLFATFATFMYWATIYIIEVRMYYWAAVFLVLSYLFDMKILESNKTSDWCGFSISSLCAAYTHYYALIAVAFLYVFLLIYIVFKHEKEKYKHLAVAYTVAVLAYLPWLIVLVQTMMRISDNYWIEKNPGVTESIKYYFESNYGKVYWIFFLISVSYVIMTESNILMINHELQSVQIQTKQLQVTANGWWVLSGVASMFGTMIVGIVVSKLVRPVFITRYLFPVAMLGWLLLSFCYSKMVKKTSWVMIAIAAVLTFQTPTFQIIKNYENEKESMLQNILNLDISGDATLLIQAVDAEEVEYLFPSCQIEKVDSIEEVNEYLKNDTKETSNIWVMGDWSEEELLRIDCEDIVHSTNGMIADKRLIVARLDL